MPMTRNVCLVYFIFIFKTTQGQKDIRLSWIRARTKIYFFYYTEGNISFFDWTRDNFFYSCYIIFISRITFSNTTLYVPYVISQNGRSSHFSILFAPLSPTYPWYIKLVLLYVSINCNTKSRFQLKFYILFLQTVVMIVYSFCYFHFYNPQCM